MLSTGRETTFPVTFYVLCVWFPLGAPTCRLPTMINSEEVSEVVFSSSPCSVDSETPPTSYKWVLGCFLRDAMQ